MKEENQAIIKALNMYGRVPEQWELLNEIERLNKKIEQYENPEDMTLMFMWCDEKAKDEIKRLNNIINEFEDILKRDIKACNNKFENMFDRNYRRLILEEKLEQLQELKGDDYNGIKK